MAITAFLSRSPGLLNRGPGGPASLGHGPHSSIFSPTDSNFSFEGPEGPLCWVLVLSTASYLQLTRTSCALSYIIILRPLNSTCRQSRLFPWYLWPDAPVIYTGAFLLLTAWPGRRSIYNKTSYSIVHVKQAFYSKLEVSFYPELNVDDYLFQIGNCLGPILRE